MKFSLRTFSIALLVICLAVPYTSIGQQAKVSQRKIEREKKKKDKAAVREYQDALKRHHQLQSKETRAMMRESQRKAKKNTPVKRK
ncbi:MAG TPA: hypothetical protein PKJ28_05050 [Bacteroidales bacterium]|nr:hypothetical protein [Bacteroidales bacterium]HPS73514.1 hypothetical protein [Bacteroidales bacterium]